MVYLPADYCDHGVAQRVQQPTNCEQTSIPLGKHGQALLRYMHTCIALTYELVPWFTYQPGTGSKAHQGTWLHVGSVYCGGPSCLQR